jgi:hypothetical protein
MLTVTQCPHCKQTIPPKDILDLSHIISWYAELHPNDPDYTVHCHCGGVIPMESVLDDGEGWKMTGRNIINKY